MVHRRHGSGSLKPAPGPLSLSPLLWAFVIVTALIVLPGSAMAVLTGYVDLTYSDVSSESEQASTQQEAKSRSFGFHQIYSLTLDRQLYPNLKLLASGLFDQNITKTKTPDQDTNQRTTTVRPLIELSLDDPIYNGSAGYSRRDDITKASGAPNLHLVNEEWRANLYWRPEALPTLQVRGSRTNTYDTDRAQVNLTDDLITVTSEFRQKGLYLRYYGTFDDATNKVVDLRTKTFTNTGEVSYENKFFGDRVQVFADYQITLNNTDVTSRGRGEVLLPTIFPFAGLSSVDDTPLDGALEQNNLLIDGNTGASAGVDLGTGSPGTPTRTWNIGLDFFTVAEVNTLFVWVDRELPSAVSQAFSWRVYASSDNMFWTLVDAAPSVQVGLFQNRFELRFTTVTSRFIKVVTDSLSPGVPVPPGTDASHIFVTELQSFLSTTSGSGKTSLSDNTQRINVFGRTDLLYNPLVYYTVAYTSVISSGRAGQPSQTRWTVLNALNLNHRLSRVFSTTAKVEKEDSSDTRGKTTAYAYTLSVNAVPMRTLNHTLTVSGRFEDNPDGHLTRNGAFLTNNIDLYKGVRLYGTGGVSVSTIETGQDEFSPSYTAGIEVSPRNNLTFLLSYNSSETRRSGGGLPETKTFTRSGDASVTYYPLRTLYLFLSLGRVSQENKSFTLHNYAVTWSPFPGGQLQASLNYNESFRSDENEKVITLTPNLRWNMSRRSWLNVSYFISRTKSDIQRAKDKIFAVNLRLGW